ncbi:hypothetical protein [Nocardia huaxiensis]|uniref:Uncharacterized protein n=1 Tax=Nocardia huaxiensis TaxID=2755382 RepID=A0A7D6Z1W8_9NOCA|nr:hypothetical protein [Nocardia huaxiensis]QLY28724.1 hypothetical protein H0264_25770 [Nocardia huaxiensis]UFS97801.1 hypothetical protein LPY97_07825 [Nocardia huaxiensis]
MRIRSAFGALGSNCKKSAIAGAFIALAAVAGAGTAEAREYAPDTVILNSGNGAVTMTYGAYVEWLTANAAEIGPEVQKAGGCAAYVSQTGNAASAKEAAPLGIAPFIAACREALGM